jgi:hypothetical protein
MKAAWSVPLRRQPGYRRRREPGGGTEELLQGGRESPEDKLCGWSSGSTSQIFGILRHHGGRIIASRTLRGRYDAGRRPHFVGGSTTLPRAAGRAVAQLLTPASDEHP